jgi:hypothetical protein
MSSKVPSQADLQANRTVLENRNANLEKLKAKALANGSTNTAAEYQRMINENNVKINDYTANINNYTSYFKAETEQLNYEKWAEGGTKGTEANPIPSSTKAQTTTTVTEVATDSGGGTYTVSRAKDTPNATSQGIQSKADALKTQSELYLVDPNTVEGQRLLQQAVANGQLSQAQVVEIRSLSADQRFDRASELANQGIALESQAQAAQTRGETTVAYTPSTTTTRVTTVNTDTGNAAPTIITGALPEAGITTQTNGNLRLQVVNNNNGTSSLTTPSGLSVTVDNNPVTSTNTTIDPASDPNTNPNTAANTPSQVTSSDIAAEWRGQALQAQQQKSEAEARLASTTQQRVQNDLEIVQLREQISNPNTSPDARNEAEQQLAALNNQNSTLALEQNSIASEIQNYQTAINVSTANAETAESAPAGVNNPTPQVVADDPAITLTPQTQDEAAFLEANGQIYNEPPAIDPATSGENFVDFDDAPIPRSQETIDPNSDAGLAAMEGIDTPSIDPAFAEDEYGAGGENIGPGSTIGVRAAPNQDQFVGDSNNSNQSPAVKFQKAADWRVRISLAPSATYLYKDPKISNKDILFPLQSTNGVIFPYLPSVQLTYSANYDATEPTHSNYKIFSYRGSAVSDIGITGDFTAQNVAEAIYLRAVIHFFRSAAKMFYGQDQAPKAGTPPPLLYLSGYGEYQFDNHPMVLSSFNYTLPNDVDYIMAGSVSGGIRQSNNPNLSPPATSTNPFLTQFNRLSGSQLEKGALNRPPEFRTVITGETTRIPTKIQIQLTFHPMVTRRTISNKFSLRDYATGKLLQGSTNAGFGGGIW